MRWRLVGLVLTAIIALSRPHPAQAHAILVASTPAVGSTITAGEVALLLRFNSRIDRARSRLTLIRADRSTQIIAIDDEGTDDVLLARTILPEGVFTVRWQVLATDGRITRGDVPLTVRAKAR